MCSICIAFKYSQQQTSSQDCRSTNSCAPRLVFISSGVSEKGDALWMHQYRSWQATDYGFRNINLKDL